MNTGSASFESCMHHSLSQPQKMIHVSPYCELSEWVASGVRCVILAARRAQLAKLQDTAATLVKHVIGAVTRRRALARTASLSRVCHSQGWRPLCLAGRAPTARGSMQSLHALNRARRRAALKYHPDKAAAGNKHWVNTIFRGFGFMCELQHIGEPP